MPKDNLKINNELDGEKLKSVAEKYVQYYFARPSKRLQDMSSLKDLYGATNPDYTKAKENYFSAVAAVPNSQKAEMKAMAEDMIQSRMKGLKNRGGGNKSLMIPTPGDK
jgi:hypothetical protein